MHSKTRPGRPGALRLAALAGAISLALSGGALAQSSAGASDVQFSQDVFNMYLESRTQKPAAQATAEEKDAVRGELTDLYLLAKQPRAKELRENPRLKAQLELQERALLAQAVATDFLAKNPATDEEIQKLYSEQVALAPPQEFKARHILVETQSEAQDLISKLDGGADFATLARENSTGPSGPNGGDLGWFAPNQMVAEFSGAVEALSDGAYTKAPVQTQFGWHVILREDSRDAAPPTLESVRDVIKQRVEQDKLQSYIDGLHGAK